MAAKATIQARNFMLFVAETGNELKSEDEF